MEESFCRLKLEVYHNQWRRVTKQFDAGLETSPQGNNQFLWLFLFPPVDDFLSLSLPLFTLVVHSFAVWSWVCLSRVKRRTDQERKWEEGRRRRRRRRGRKKREEEEAVKTCLLIWPVSWLWTLNGGWEGKEMDEKEKREQKKGYETKLVNVWDEGFFPVSIHVMSLIPPFVPLTMFCSRNFLIPVVVVSSQFIPGIDLITMITVIGVTPSWHNRSIFLSIFVP